MSEAPEIEGKAAAPVPFFRLETIKKRVHFKAANGGARFSTPAFTLLRAPEAGGAGIRFGFTVTKKLGKAVLRNRIRRRLRAAALEALRAAGPNLVTLAMDLVVLARSAAAERPHAALSADMRRALEALDRKPAAPEKPAKAGGAGIPASADIPAGAGGAGKPASI